MNIKILKPSDVREKYVNWFSNKDVVRYSDNQYRSFTLEGQKKYVENCLKDSNILLYGIFEGDLHIGNVVINGLKSIHKRAEISYVIGEKFFGERVLVKLLYRKLLKYLEMT